MAGAFGRSVYLRTDNSWLSTGVCVSWRACEDYVTRGHLYYNCNEDLDCSEEYSVAAYQCVTVSRTFWTYVYILKHSIYA